MIADSFARGIAEHPADWHMLQRFWPDQTARVTQPSAEPAVGAEPGPG